MFIAHYSLFLAIATSVLVAIIIRFFDKFKIDSFQAIGFNYIICIISGIIAHTGKINAHYIYNQPWFLYALMLGCGFIAMFNLFAISTSKIGLALSSVFSKMSVIIPVYSGILLYRDNFNIYKVTGLVLTILAFYFIFKKGVNVSHLRNVKHFIFILPLLLIFGNGFNDTMQTYCSRVFRMDNDTILLFMICIYIIALTVSVIIFIYRRVFMNYRIQMKNIFAGIILGIFNFATTFYFIKTIGFYESTFVFPIFNVSIVGLTTLAGVTFFNEKLRGINWLGIILAVLAIIVIAMG